MGLLRSNNPPEAGTTDCRPIVCCDFIGVAMPHRTSPSIKRDAPRAVRTPDETVWGFRASDIYQGGETEPPHADRAVPAAFQSLDNEFEKNYLPVAAQGVRAHVKTQILP